MKLTLILEYPSLKHPANRHKARIFQEVMDEPRRRIARREDTVIMDKGLYAYKNYLIGINEYRIVPLIFPRSNFDLNRYTRRSVLKFAALNVLLVGIVVALGFREKKVLQRLAEM